MLLKKNSPLKKALITASVIFNALFLLLLVFTLTRKTSALAFYRMDQDDGPYVTAAFVVSVPSGNANVVFGPAEFSIQAGTEAALQISLHKEGQLNLTLDPLYDHSVISVEQSGYGLIIKGIAPGKTVLQTFGGQGIKNIAEITVTLDE